MRERDNDEVCVTGYMCDCYIDHILTTIWFHIQSVTTLLLRRDVLNRGPRGATWPRLSEHSLAALWTSWLPESLTDRDRSYEYNSMTPQCSFLFLIHVIRSHRCIVYFSVITVYADAFCIEIPQSSIYNIRNWKKLLPDHQLTILNLCQLWESNLLR